MIDFLDVLKTRHVVLRDSGCPGATFGDAAAVGEAFRIENCESCLWLEEE